MLDPGKIAIRQMIFIIFFTSYPTAILFLPSALAEDAKQDAWLSLTIVTLVFAIVGIIYVKLGERFAGLSIIEYGEIILGRWIGKIFGLIFIFYLFINNGLIIREYAEFLATGVMTDTPIMVFIVLMMFLTSYAVNSGIEVMSRTMEFIFPLFIIATLMGITFLFNEIDWENFIPLLENGMKPIIKGSLTPAHWMSEAVIITLFYPNINDKAKATQSLVYGILLIGLLMLPILIYSIGVFGVTLSTHLVYPTYDLIRYIKVADIERPEVIIAILWVAGSFAKIGIYHYACVVAIAQLLKLKDYKPLTLPIGIILIYLAITAADNYPSFKETISVIVLGFLIYEVLYPLALLLLSLLFKKKQKER